MVSWPIGFTYDIWNNILYSMPHQAFLTVGPSCWNSLQQAQEDQHGEAQGASHGAILVGGK